MYNTAKHLKISLLTRKIYDSSCLCNKDIWTNINDNFQLQKQMNPSDIYKISKNVDSWSF
jgi:hypothetical protein